MAFGDAGTGAFAFDAPPIQDCDRLAATPDSVPDVPGVAFDAIDAAAAVAACEQAMRNFPGVARFAFQYGRALHRAGQAGAAARLYEWAATDGVAAAQYALARMLQTGDGVIADPAEAEYWLRAAAVQGFAPAAEALANPPPAAPPAGADAADAADDGLAALADRFDGIADILDRLSRDAPRSRFDPLAVLQPAGISVEALTAWVGTNIALVPYRGSLRGARGTLMDRYANSLDRALLLAELLADAGHDVRLARATIDAAAADALLAGFAPPAPDDAPAMDTAALAAELAAAAPDGVDPGQSARDGRDLQAAIRTRTADLTQALLATIGDPPGDAALTSHADAIAALSDHWWVQVRDGDGWIDADPSAAAVGALVPQETLLPGDLPQALRHAVTLRLVIEVWEDGRLREDTVLSHRLVPADLIGRPVVLRQVPLGTPPTQRLLETTDPVAAVLGAAADAWVWQPELTIGGEPVVDRLFTMRGEVLPATPETRAHLGLDNGLFGDLGDRLDTVFDEPGQEPPEAPDDATGPVGVTAEWLEIAIEVPGEPAAVHRRTVFDLLGPAARSAAGVPAADFGAAERMRRGLALMREVDVMVNGGALAASFVRQAMARDGADLLRVVAPLLRSPGGDGAGVLASLPRIQVPLNRYALLRFSAPTDGGAQPYLDRPNVALTWQGVAGTGGDDLRATWLFDIVANDVAIPGDGRLADHVAQGVRDTVVEDALAGPAASGNTAALHEADRAAGRTWIRLDPTDPGALDRLDLPADARAGIARDLAAGAIVVAPPAPVDTASGPQVAWWRIDGRNGTTLGMTPAGGAVLTEDAVLTTMQGVQVGGCFAMMALTISGGMGGVYAGAAVCVAGGITGAVAGGLGGFVLSSTSSLIGGVIAVLAS